MRSKDLRQRLVYTIGMEPLRRLAEEMRHEALIGVRHDIELFVRYLGELQEGEAADGD